MRRKGLMKLNSEYTYSSEEAQAPAFEMAVINYFKKYDFKEEIWQDH